MDPVSRVVFFAVVLLGIVLLFHGGEAASLPRHVVNLQQSKAHGYTPATGPSRTAILEGGPVLLPNRITQHVSKVPTTFTEGTPRQAEGRGRRGVLRRLALPLLILLAVKAGLTLPVIFGGVALAAFKGLWTGSSALMMTSAMALKNMIPPPKIIVPSGHAHVQDIIATEYRRADPYYRDDYSRYGGYGYK